MSDDKVRASNVAGKVFREDTFLNATGTTNLATATRRLNETISATYDYQRNRDGDLEEIVTPQWPRYKRLPQRTSLKACSRRR